MSTLKYIQSEYPLHWAVWNDDHKELQELIKTNQVRFYLHFHFLFLKYSSVVAASFYRYSCHCANSTSPDGESNKQSMKKIPIPILRFVKFTY